jgi:hypothetical protein
MNAQTPIFELWFEDSAGNRDTLWFGYDPTATRGVDDHLGEANIMGEPYDSTLFVFFTDAGEDSGFRTTLPIKTTTSTFMMKTQLMSQVYHPLEIGIIAKNWPLSISWPTNELKGYTNQSMFVMTGFYPSGCWFDCLSCGNWPDPFTIMEEISEIEVFPDYFCKYFNEISPDTINLLYVSSEYGTLVEELKHNNIDIKYSVLEKTVKISRINNHLSFHVNVLDMSGRKVLARDFIGITEQSIIISMDNFRKGIYLIVVSDYTSKQKLAIQKITVL